MPNRMSLAGSQVVQACDRRGCGLDAYVHGSDGRFYCRAHFRAATLEALLRETRDKRGGFIPAAVLPQLAALDRLRQVLVRWHEGRAVVAAQDAGDLIAAAAKGGWTVRDVSLPCSDPVYYEGPTWEAVTKEERAPYGRESRGLAGEWGVWCEVFGGVTGPRAAWLKHDGNVQRFASKDLADHEARLLAARAAPNARANFRYTAKGFGD